MDCLSAIDDLRRFPVLKNVIPSEDTFLRLFRLLDPKQFEACFRRWVSPIVTALGGTLAIAGKIVAQDGDYLLAVKGNQPGLLQSIQDAFLVRKDEAVRHACVEKSHGRILSQIASMLPADGIVDKTTWPNCQVIGRIDSVRQIGEKVAELEQRYDIASRPLTPEPLAQAYP